MKNLALIGLVFATAACKDKADKPKSADWGDDPRPLGACVGRMKAGGELIPGVETWCLEQQSKTECGDSDKEMSYVWLEHHTCASQGFSKECDLPDFPISMRFKQCPQAAPLQPSPTSPASLEAAREVVAIFDAAARAGAATQGDCKAFGDKLSALRPRLWDLGKAHPRLLASMSDADLKRAGAADAMKAVTDALVTCKGNAHAIEFSFAIGKLM